MPEHVYSSIPGVVIREVSILDSACKISPCWDFAEVPEVPPGVGHTFLNIERGKGARVSTVLKHLARSVQCTFTVHKYIYIWWVVLRR